MDKATRKQKDAARLEKLNIDKACENLLATREGRHYLWWLLRIGRVGSQPFTNNALATSFGCGELNVGQQILAHIIEVDPAGYALMIQEKANDEREWRELAKTRNTELASNADDESGEESRPFDEG